MAPPDAALSADGRETGAFEHAEVFRHGGQRHVEPAGDLLDGPVAARELGEDFAARTVGQGAERGVERILGVNHLVYYWTLRAIRQ